MLTTVANGATKTASWDYLYDADNVGVETYVANGITEKTFYVAGKNVDEHLGMVRAGQKYFFHQDGLGSVTTITNGSQGIVQSYTYDSFGLPKPATTFRNYSYTFTGREWDKEIGLYYYRARYYDPVEGRFVSRDPIAYSAGDVVLYGYTGSNVINFKDPTGLATCFYSVTNGQMTCTPDNPENAPFIGKFASGNNSIPGCKNNPACTGIKGVGPIPLGDWIWTDEYTSKKNGRSLSPLPGTNKEGRSLIRSHSCKNAFGPSRNPKYCSEGCVTGSEDDVKRLNVLLDAEPGSILHVLE